MVKCNAAKDYYADLGIPPHATNAEIKKQYYKLALICHPDRNAGREAEFAPRFQAIQEAYEVLNDPDEKATYDAKRKRGTVNSNSSAKPDPQRRSNPYQATSNFPPPPRRTAPRPTTEVPPTAKTGANRYSQWQQPRPIPRTAETSTTRDARTREERFNAWQQVHNAPRQQDQGFRRHNVPPPYQGQQRPVPVPPPSTQGSRPHSPRRQATSNTSPPRSAYEEVHGPASAPRVFSNHANRKAGFDPLSPAVDGDEAPAVGPSQYRSPFVRDSDHGFTQNETPGDASPMPPTSRRPNRPVDSRAQSGDDVPFTEGVAKEKTPYPGNVGERTHYFDTDALRRTSSVIDQTNLHFRPGDTAARRRSDQGRPQHPPPPLPPPPAFEMSDHENLSGPDALPSEQWAKADPSNPRNRATYDYGPPKKPTVQRMPEGCKSEREPLREGASIRLHAPHLKEPMSRSSNPEMRSPSLERRSSLSQSPSAYARPDATPTSGRSRSHPNIFSTSSQNQYSSSESDDRGPTQDTPETTVPPPPPPPKEDTFSADRWTKNLEEENWASNWAFPVDHRQTSPLRSSVNNRRSKGPGSSRVPARSDSGRSETPQSSNAGGRGFGNPPFSETPQDGEDGVDPMDVDVEPPTTSSHPSIGVEGINQTSQPPRTVHVELSKPEWRDHVRDDAGNFNHTPATLPSFHPANYQNMTDPPLQQSEQVTSAHSTRPPAGLETMPITFSHVSPFETSKLVNGRKAAFSNLAADLGADLPFHSQASVIDPTISPVPPGPLPTKDLLQPPQAPPCPGRITPTYLQEFSAYITEYHSFYSTILARLQAVTAAQTIFTAPNSASPTNPNPRIFQASGVLNSQPLQGSGVMPFWLSAAGETQDKKGWNTFFALARQAAQMRRHLDVAAERHLTALEAHDRLRERERAANSAGKVR